MFGLTSVKINLPFLIFNYLLTNQRNIFLAFVFLKFIDSQDINYKKVYHVILCVFAQISALNYVEENTFKGYGLLYLSRLILLPRFH